MFLLNYTTSYTGSQQIFMKRRYVYNTCKLHEFIHTEAVGFSTAFVSIYRTTPLNMKSDSTSHRNVRNFCQITQLYILAGSNSHSHGRENLQCSTVYKIFLKMSLNSSEIIPVCLLHLFSLNEFLGQSENVKTDL